MNLADAIRNASQSGKASVSVSELIQAPAVSQPESLGLEADATATEDASPTKKSKAKAAPEQTMSEPNHNTANPGTNVVRLELTLTAEQIALLFKSIVTGQHTVMTLREAAAHLRMTNHALEALAQEGEVPAFHLDGRWRFSRVALDEWLALRPNDRREQEAA